MCYHHGGKIHDMRILCVLAAVFSILIYAGCISGDTAVPVPSDNGNGKASALSTMALNITAPMDESVVRSSPVTVSGSTDPGADVMINGLSVDTENGHFSAMVELELGPNQIEVTARAAAGQATKYLTVVYVP